ncbi:MAG: hypothetical protein V1944_01160 [Candidatus Aenigmatarchaeota archaeon]
MGLVGCGIVLSVVLLEFLVLFDLAILKERRIYSVVFDEKNIYVLYIELVLTFYGLLYILKRAYDESVLFWKKESRRK